MDDDYLRSRERSTGATPRHATTPTTPSRHHSTTPPLFGSVTPPLHHSATGAAPRHAIDGLVSGGIGLGRGVIEGLTGVISAPIEGAQAQLSLVQSSLVQPFGASRMLDLESSTGCLTRCLGSLGSRDTTRFRDHEFKSRFVFRRCTRE